MILTFIGISALEKTRVYTLVRILFKNPLIVVRGLDESASDRFNSTFLGFTAPILNPKGYGINAYKRIFEDCEHPIPKNYNLMCENPYNSKRNNNIFGNFTQDGGILGLLTVFGILIYSSDLRSFNFSNLVALSGIIFLGLFLPFPLGASTFWILTMALINI